MDTSQFKPRRRWPVFLGAGLGLVLVLYFVLTSGPVLKALVLPRVASALHCEVTAGELSLSPFSSLVLRDLKVTPVGSETLATVREVRVRYSLMAILGGTTRVSEVTVETPVITVVGHPDGTSNLSKLLDSLNQNQVPAPPEPPGPPPRLEVRNVAVKNGTLRQTLVSTNGTTTAEISGLNVSVDQLVNGAPAKVTVASVLSLAAPPTNQISARLGGEITADLDARLQPSRVAGGLDLAVTGASGAFRDLARVASRLSLDATASEVKEVRLAITESGRAAGEFNISGPVDLEKKEMRLAYEVKGIDRAALGLAGAMAGVDFGQTSMSAAGRIDLAQRGQLFASFGKLTVNRMTLGKAGVVTPAIDTSAEYKFSVNLADKTALVERADLSVSQSGAEVIRGGLDRPMNIAWSNEAPGFREATYSLSVRQFEIGPWLAMGGTNLPTGRLNVTSSITAERDGRRLKLVLDTGLDRLALDAAGRRLQDLGTSLKLSGTLDDFKVLQVDKMSGDVQHAGGVLARYAGTISWNQRTGEATAEATVDADLPRMLKLHPVEGVDLKSGDARLNLQANITTGQTNGVFGASLSGLDGTAFGAVLQDFQAQLETAGGMTTELVALRRGSLLLRSGVDAGGSLDLTGEFNVKSHRGKFEFKTINLNEKAIGPFVAAAVAPNELKSISLDWNGVVQLDPSGETSVKSGLKVSRLVARDPAGRLPDKPLAFGLDLDAGQRARSLDLRGLEVDLGATARAANRLKATGKFDFATNKPAPSSLVVTSDGLDFTELYNLFAGDGGSSSKPSTAGPSKPAPSTPATKPGEPVVLPLKEFTLDSRLAAVFLRDVAISNFVTKLAITGGSKVNLNPFSLTLNGAPVTAAADLDLGIPGYRYDVNAGLQSVPIPPIARSLLTGPHVDLKGTVNGNLKLKGAGVEGADLRKNLAGTAEFAATNLDYQVSALQTPLMKVLVGTISVALKGPNLSSSPLQYVGARLEAGQGAVQVASGRVSSDAFAADVQGRIDLADVLTNSPIQLPVTVSLPKEGRMQPLPVFLTMKGTVGAPKPDIDALALAKAMTQLPGAAGSLVNQGVSQLGSTLDKALGKGGSTNAGPASSLIKGLLGGGTSTNAAKVTNTAAGGTNAPAKPFNPLDLLRKGGK